MYDDNQARGRDAKTTRKSDQNRNVDLHLILLVFVAVGLACAMALEVLGHHNLLALFAAAMVTAAFVLATIAWLIGAKPNNGGAKTWNLSGALAFIGFAAAMIAN
ncbi:MAG: hypothetical protein HOO99_12070 [Hyphomicrobiaceae bacterium]|nr:hypothetical protein [Hyphomicrobiaceae bacterium]